MYFHCVPIGGSVALGTNAKPILVSFESKVQQSLFRFPINQCRIFVIVPVMTYFMTSLEHLLTDLRKCIDRVGWGKPSRSDVVSLEEL